LSDPTERLLRRIDEAWTALQESCGGLSDAQLTAPGTMGAWSVKDVLAHVSTWEEEALKYLPLIARGGRPPRYAAQGGIDAFNARMAAQKQALPLGEVLEQLAETHRRLIELVRSAPADQLDSRSRFRRRLRLDTYGHYPIHAEMIRAWRTRARVVAEG
jgi:uncharacterized protein (TIGR03083 family)